MTIIANKSRRNQGLPCSMEVQLQTMTNKWITAMIEIKSEKTKKHINVQRQQSYVQITPTNYIFERISSCDLL